MYNASIAPLMTDLELLSSHLQWSRGSRGGCSCLVSVDVGLRPLCSQKWQLSELSCRAAINITTSTGKDSGLEKGNQS